MALEVEKEKVKKLENKIEKLENDLVKFKDRLHKLTPQKPLFYDYKKYDHKNQQLVTYCNYYCSWCGEQLYRPKTKAVSKHKCGQMIDWKFQIVNNLESGDETK